MNGIFSCFLFVLFALTLLAANGCQWVGHSSYRWTFDGQEHVLEIGKK